MLTTNQAIKTTQSEKADQLDRKALLERCSDLANKPSILYELGQCLERHGFAGPTDIPKTIFLATLTRMLPRPVSAVIKGPSSSGKSFALEGALRYVPAEAYEKFQGLSDRALVYSGDLDLQHRILVIGEAAGLADGNGRTFLRQLLTEDLIRYRTVSQSKEGHAARELVIKGPVGLLMTTTANFLHGEDETRVLSLQTDQSPEQIKRALAATLLDCPSAPSEDELGRWHALHNYVCSGDHRVQIPYNRILIDRLPTQQRVLRDAPKVLALIAAHTLLNQCSRKRNEAGQIVAEIYDYYIVHDLIAEPLSQGLQASVAPHIREVVESVALLLEDKNDGNPIGISDLCDFLGKENSTVSRNVQAAIRDGYLDNLNPGQGRRHALIPGERALPSGSVLPDPEELDQAFKKTRNK